MSYVVYNSVSHPKLILRVIGINKDSRLFKTLKPNEFALEIINLSIARKVSLGHPRPQMNLSLKI